MNSTRDALHAAFDRQVRVDPYRDGELVTVPITNSAGNLIQVYVEPLSETRWFLSDEGQAADELAMAGVDLSRPTPHESFNQIMRSLALESPTLMGVSSPYDIAGVTTSDNLGDAILDVAAAAVRADALKALGHSRRSPRFRDRIIRAADARNVPVLTNAPMPTKHGGSRKVTLRFGRRTFVYAQAITASRSPIDGFDKAQGVFTSANVDKGQLAAVVARGVSLESWQRAILGDLGTVVQEDALDHFLSNID